MGIITDEERRAQIKQRNDQGEACNTLMAAARELLRPHQYRILVTTSPPEEGPLLNRMGYAQFHIAITDPRDPEKRPTAAYESLATGLKRHGLTAASVQELEGLNAGGVTLLTSAERINGQLANYIDLVAKTAKGRG